MRLQVVKTWACSAERKEVRWSGMTSRWSPWDTVVVLADVALAECFMGIRTWKVSVEVEEVKTRALLPGLRAVEAVDGMVILYCGRGRCVDNVAISGACAG